MTAPPKYPADAVAARTTGKVVVIVDVAADGSVSDARVEKSEPAGVFDQVTLEAVKKWTFQPALKDGKRSEEHTSELQSLMRISYAVFCLNKKHIILQEIKNTNNKQDPPTPN